MANRIHNFFKRNSISENAFVKQVPLLRTLTNRELVRIEEMMHERSYEPGEYIFHIHQPGAAIFFIKEGDVRVFIPADTLGDNDNMEKKDIEIAVLQRGEFFGELALLDNSPRSASVMAKTQTEVMAIFRGDFEELLIKDPVISSKINRQLAIMIGRRLKEANY